MSNADAITEENFKLRVCRDRGRHHYDKRECPPIRSFQGFAEPHLLLRGTRVRNCLGLTTYAQEMKVNDKEHQQKRPGMPHAI